MAFSALLDAARKRVDRDKAAARKQSEFDKARERAVKSKSQGTQALQALENARKRLR